MLAFSGHIFGINCDAPKNKKAVWFMLEIKVLTKAVWLMLTMHPKSSGVMKKLVQ